jgi:hypothetical protein
MTTLPDQIERTVRLQYPRGHHSKVQLVVKPGTVSVPEIKDLPWQEAVILGQELEEAARAARLFEEIAAAYHPGELGDELVDTPSVLGAATQALNKAADALGPRKVTHGPCGGTSCFLCGGICAYREKLAAVCTMCEGMLSHMVHSVEDPDKPGRRRHAQGSPACSK